MSFGELRILIIEDESMITMLLEDTLADMGCQVVAVASQLDEAMEKAASLDFDVAILDVNLNGSRIVSCRRGPGETKHSIRVHNRLRSRRRSREISASSTFTQALPTRRLGECRRRGVRARIGKPYRCRSHGKIHARGR